MKKAVLRDVLIGLLASTAGGAAWAAPVITYDAPADPDNKSDAADAPAWDGRTDHGAGAAGSPLTFNTVTLDGRVVPVMATRGTINQMRSESLFDFRLPGAVRQYLDAAETAPAAGERRMGGTGAIIAIAGAALLILSAGLIAVSRWRRRRSATQDAAS